MLALALTTYAAEHATDSESKETRPPKTMRGLVSTALIFTSLNKKYSFQLDPLHQSNPEDVFGDPQDIHRHMHPGVHYPVTLIFPHYPSMTYAIFSFEPDRDNPGKHKRKFHFRSYSCPTPTNMPPTYVLPSDLITEN